LELDGQRIVLEVEFEYEYKRRKETCSSFITPSPHQTVFTRLTTLDKLLLPVISG
jgi:hypothetical protein